MSMTPNATVTRSWPSSSAARGRPAARAPSKGKPCWPSGCRPDTWNSSGVARAPRYPWLSSVRSDCERGGVDAVERGGILGEDRPALLVRQGAGVVLEHLLRPRPRGITVREVVRPHEPVPVQQVCGLERDPVVLERHVNVLGEVLGRQPRQLLTGR